MKKNNYYINTKQFLNSHPLILIKIAFIYVEVFINQFILIVLEMVPIR